LTQIPKSVQDISGVPSLIFEGYGSPRGHKLEGLLAQQPMRELISDEPAAVIFEDNTGCNLLMRNQKTGSRTKHIKVRCFCGGMFFKIDKWGGAFLDCLRAVWTA
jgi:hypothetical protein